MKPRLTKSKSYTGCQQWLPARGKGELTKRHSRKNRLIDGSGK